MLLRSGTIPAPTSKVVKLPKSIRGSKVVRRPKGMRVSKKVVEVLEGLELPPDLLEMSVDLRKHSDFSIIKLLGEGGQGKVVLIRSVEGKEYAAKAVKYGIERGDLNNSLADFNFSLIMDHPYTIKSYEVIVGDEYMFLIMEKADEDLASLLKRRECFR